MKLSPILALALLASHCTRSSGSHLKETRATPLVSRTFAEACAKPTETERAAVEWLLDFGRETCETAHEKIQTQFSTYLLSQALRENVPGAAAFIIQGFAKAGVPEQSDLNLNLSLAAQIGSEEVFDLLLGHSKASLEQLVGQRTESSLRLLQNAAIGGNLSLVTRILQVPGVDVNELGYPCTPLMSAIEHKRIEVARLLLKDDRIQLSIPESCYVGYYSMAVNNDDATIIEELTKHPSIDVNQPQSTLDTAPLNKAVAQKKHAALEALLKHPSIVVNGKGLVYDAASNGDEEALRLLLEVPGIDLNSPSGPINYSPLFAALMQGHIGAAKILLNAPGIDVKAEHGGATLLHMAAQSGDLDLVKRLVTEGFDINKAADRGWTPALHAAVDQKWDVLLYLMDLPNIDLRAIETEYGRNVLHWAAYWGHLPTAMKLISSGKVDPTADDSTGLSPAQVATSRWHRELSDAITKAINTKPIEYQLTGAITTLVACIENHIAGNQRFLDSMANEWTTKSASCDLRTYTRACVPSDLKSFSSGQRGFITWYRGFSPCPQGSRAFDNRESALEYLKTAADEARLAD